jgi:hypothetical protein
MKQAKTMIQQTTPYSWAKAVHVWELTNPHLYYLITGAHNCQVLKKIDLPLTTEKLSLLPSPAHGPDGTFRIQISFTVNFGRQEHQHKADAWKLIEPHIQHIYPAARIMAESYMELTFIKQGDDLNKLQKHILPSPSDKAASIQSNQHVQHTSNLISGLIEGFIHTNFTSSKERN